MSIPWLADVLRAAGLTVVEHSGWKTHDRPGTWEPQFIVVHATAAPKSQDDDVQVRVVRDGRADLNGPIANACIDRRGRWHVLSAGRCNTTIAGTAGPFDGKGNTHALGIEACNDNRSEPWPAVQYDSYVRGVAAICRRMGWPASRAVGHKEHTPGHKTDPTFSMGTFRSNVAAALDGKDDDDMAFTEDDLKRLPWNQLARAAQGGDPAMSTLAVLNGSYNEVKALRAAITANAAAEAQRDAADAARDAGMMTVLQTIVGASGVLTEQQLAGLVDQVRAAATAAGRAAAAAVEAKVDRIDQSLTSLREHLGDVQGGSDFSGGATS